MRLTKVKINDFRKPRTLLSALLNISLLLLVLYPLLQPQFADATVTEGFVRFDRLSTGSAVSGTACLKSTLTTQTNVVLVFPVGWTISQTAANWTVTTTNLPTDPSGGGAATTWPGIGTATSVIGQSVVFPGTALTAGTFYCFNFAGASSTVGSAGNDQTGQLNTEGGNPYTDTLNYATSVVSSGGELITVNASVSATMTFSLSSNSINLGTLSTSAVSSGNVTETVGTNARNGWVSWLKGTEGTTTLGALHSTTANADISVPTGSYPNVYDLSTTTGYVIDAVSGTGSPAIATAYNGGNATSGGVSTTLYEQMASNTAPTAGDTVTINARAKISATQAAASDYTDTLTITAAGSF